MNIPALTAEQIIRGALMLALPLLLIFFVLLSLTLSYHWRRYGTEFGRFFLFRIVYFVGAAFIVAPLLAAATRFFSNTQ